MSLKRAVHVLLLSFVALFASGAAAEARILRMPFYSSPGQIWRDANGELQGLRVRVLKELNRRLAKDGIELKYVIAPEGRIHFAGEHASLAHTWMQGALESGLRATQQMLEATQKTQ